MNASRPPKGAAYFGVTGVTAGLAAVHIAVLMWGFGGLFAKWVELSPWLLVFWRLLFATPALAAVIRIRGEGFPLPRARIGWLVAVNGAVLAVHWTAFFHAVQVSTVAVALLGYVSAPVFAVILEPFFFPEPFSRRSLGAAALIVAGMAIIVPHWDWSDSIFQGLLWGLLSGFTFAVLILLNRFLVRHLGSFVLAFYLDASALVVLIPVAAWSWTLPTPEDFALLVLQGIVFTAVSHTLFIWGLQTVRAHVAAIVGSLEPIYGIALAAWLLGEIPSLRTLAGGVSILVAVIWVSLAKARPQTPARPAAIDPPPPG